MLQLILFFESNDYVIDDEDNESYRYPSITKEEYLDFENNLIEESFWNTVYSLDI